MAKNDKGLTFVLGGLSKTLGLPQMKLGWIILNGPADVVAEARQRLEIIADTYLSVNAPVQNAVSEWFKLKEQMQCQIKDRLSVNLNFLKQELQKVKGTQC